MSKSRASLYGLVEKTISNQILHCKACLEPVERDKRIWFTHRRRDAEIWVSGISLCKNRATKPKTCDGELPCDENPSASLHEPNSNRAFQILATANEDSVPEISSPELYLRNSEPLLEFTTITRTAQQCLRNVRA